MKLKVIMIKPGVLAAAAFLSLLLYICYGLLFVPEIRIEVSKTVGEMRAIADALEAYQSTYGHYPAPLVVKNGAPASFTTSTLTFVNVSAIGLKPTYTWPCIATGDSSYKGSRDYRDWSTSSRLGFSPLPYRYAPIGNGFIIIAAGPDRDYDIDPFRDYDPVNRSEPSLHLLAEGCAYDASNGTISSGDIFRVKQ